jgi:hypothetical protein
MSEEGMLIALMMWAQLVIQSYHPSPRFCAFAQNSVGGGKSLFDDWTVTAMAAVSALQANLCSQLRHFNSILRF